MSIAEPYTPESDEPHCPECGEAAEWIPCPSCSGLAEGTLHVGPEVKPETLQAFGEMMHLVKKRFCETCEGNGGRFRCSLGCKNM